MLFHKIQTITEAVTFKGSQMQNQVAFQARQTKHLFFKVNYQNRLHTFSDKE